MRHILLALCLVGIAQAAPSKPAPVRDPFIVLGTRLVEPRQQPSQHNRQKASPRRLEVVPADKNGEDRPTLEVETVGLLLSPSGNRAILRSSTQDHIVAEGQKLGDYEILQIDSKRIVWRTNGVRGETPVTRPSR